MGTTMQAAVLEAQGRLKVQAWPDRPPSPGMVKLRVRRAGICGSDIHYFEHGRCGAFVPSRPFVLGHEFAGEVVGLGDGVENLPRATRVTANPARSCGVCHACKTGRGNLCRKTIMLGSASNTPPTDGVFGQFVHVRADQCHVLPASMDDATGALLEPLAVALHAIKRSGGVAGKRVLVTGGGPIGLLVAMTAKTYGAVPVVLSDVLEARRSTALRFGADFVLNPANDLTEVARELTGEGFDTVFEASGAPVALRQALGLVRPGGTIVQIGTFGGDDVALPANLLMNKEVNYIGSMRYGDVFDEAIRLVTQGRMQLSPLVSAVLPLARIEEAVRLAAGRSEVLKVQVEID